MVLSKLAYELLNRINQATTRDSNGKLLSYYVPIARDGVSGAGDASCLRSLEAKGLLERQMASDYSFSITQRGIEELT